jgi:hypothetical protein
MLVETTPSGFPLPPGACFIISGLKDHVAIRSAYNPSFSPVQFYINRMKAVNIEESTWAFSRRIIEEIYKPIIRSNNQ